MLAEQASSTDLMLPRELREKARVFGSELAWTAPFAVEVVSWLASEQCAVVGVELWREEDGHPFWIATSNYSPGFHDAITPKEVARCMHEANEFIQAYCGEFGALFNLTWLEPTSPLSR